jgi:hypothetical protein
VIEVDERLADLGVGVHHERTVASDGFTDRAAREDDDLRARSETE